MKRIIISISVLLSIGIGSYVFLGLLEGYRKNTDRPDSVHIHAGFKIVIEGEVSDFSNPRYMYIEPCGIDNENEHVTPQDRVHLHNGEGSVAHIHAEGVKWFELFESMGVSPDNLYHAFALNFEEVDTLLERVILDTDTALFVFSDDPEIDMEKWIHEMVTKEYIEQISISSIESCG